VFELLAHDREEKMMLEENAIVTAPATNDPAYKPKRAQRIEEALAFAGGTVDAPNKHVISVLPAGREAYFMKPGKEAQRKIPNIHDMLPEVGKDGVSETATFTFEVIWEHLVEISIINQILFKKVLVLIYRNCFFIDHAENEHGNLRYSPSPEVLDCIDKIDYAVCAGFNDKFKKEKIGLLELLHFIDLLGWNEDVKYHVTDNAADFTARDAKVGRPNTIISVISVPLRINDFLSNVIENVDRVERINVRLILSTMQQLSKSRGVYPMAHKQLREYLSPYLDGER